MTKLTKRAVEAAQSGGKRYFLWCSELPGFGCRISPQGRAYYVDYRNKAGERKRMAIGPHGKLTTEEARKLALGMLGEVVKGGDPALERTTRRTSLTLAGLCDNYMRDAERGLVQGKNGRPKKASTLEIDRGRIARHIKPLLGRKLVIDITHADLNRFVRDVASGKTADATKTIKGRVAVTGGPGTATRTMGFLGGILSYAVSEGVIPFNPARGVKRPAYNTRNRRLTPVEYGLLGEAVEASYRAGEVWQVVEGARLLALTGLRLGEVTGLRWSEVDMPGSAIRLIDSKEGHSVRPIGGPVVELLSKLPRSGDFVFPAVRREGSFTSMAAGFGRIAKRAGFSDVTPHIMRHSFASTAGDLGYSEPTISTLLGHSAGSVTSRYIHHLDAVLIAAADKVANEIAQAMMASHHVA